MVLLVLLQLFAITEPMLARWEEFSQKPETQELVRWLRCRAYAQLAGTRCGEELKAVPPSFFGRLGIFITLKKGKKVRGCFGAFSHASPDIASVLADYLSGALTRDPRYEPLDAGELGQTDIIISITTQPYAVTDLDSIDALRYGIAVACGDGLAGVYVPAELRDAGRIQKLVKGKECQVSAFRAVTIQQGPEHHRAGP